MLLKRLIDDTSGDAIVEAAMIFPIMIMIFAALVLLAAYLPARAALQRATQHAATAIATEISDTWLYYDNYSDSYAWVSDKNSLDNVYSSLFSGRSASVSKGERIVKEAESRSISLKSGELSVACSVDNRLIYKEVVVTATREFTLPVDLEYLSFVKFPKTVAVTVTSTAVVQNGDEFVRSIDLAVDFVDFIAERFNLNSISEGIGSVWGRVSAIFGWE